MKVATWNVRHGRPRRGFTSNRKLAAAVAALDVDVLAVQEVERRVIRSWFADQPRLIANASDATALRYAPARPLALIGSDGVALCVRGRATFRAVELPHRWGQQRVAVIADTEFGSIVTTHLQNHADEAREQLEWLRSELASLPRPCVLLGDLNLSRDDVAVVLRGSHLTLAGGPPTEPAESPVQRIDHIAVDGYTIDDVRTVPAPVSDHRALIATLTSEDAPDHPAPSR